MLVSGGSSGASHHAGTKVDQVGRAVYDDGDGRAGAVRIDDWRAGAEDDELGVAIIRGLGKPRRSQTKNQRDGSH